MKNLLMRYKGFVFLVVLLGVWELIGQSKIVNPPEFFPPITDILATLFQLIASFELPTHLGLTLYRSLAGLAIASIIAVPLGIWMGSSKFVRDILNPTVELLRPTPPAAIIPIAILFFGIHDTMKLVVIVFGCIWPILINTISGVRNLNTVLIETGKTFNLTGRQFLWEIVLKGASPYILTGIRISLAISIILAIVSEMIAGNNGLGFFIIISERSFQIKEMYAGIIAIAILGFSLNHLFVYVADKHIMKWYKGYTAQI